ncbi:type I secretion target, partial [Klebsiella pneumoniae]|nr:type I secretion target [Klebsiella pneumoniae]
GGDRLEGGAGNDTYMVDHAGDIVVETDTGLNDTVWSSRNYTLPDRIESLVLTGSAVLGTGNADANALLGSSRANTLTGLE